MNPRLVSSLFVLLRRALRIDTVASDIALSDDEWNILFHFSVKHNIVALVADGISQLSEAQRPPRKVWLRFCAEQARVEARFNSQQQALSELLRFFQQHGVPTMLLKGSALAACYPRPSYRESVDIDIYHFGEYRNADRLISQTFDISIGNDAHHHTKYLFKGSMVEDHYDFVNIHTPRSNRQYEAILKSLAKESIEVKFSGYPVCVATPTFNALFLVRHLAGHFVAGQITVRDLCDWRMFLNSYADQVDWQYVTRIYHQYNMYQFVGALQGIIEDGLSQSPIQGLPRTSDTDLQNKIQHDILNGSEVEPVFEAEDMRRIAWKVRRFKSNSWKYPIVYSDSLVSIIISSLLSHLSKPKSIIHKV